MMASPSSPLVRPSCRALTPGAAVNLSSKLRRNSLVSDHEDMVLLREKLTRIAVGRHHNATTTVNTAQDTGIEEERKCGNPNGHFKVLQLLPPERPSTPPSSPQPRDVLRKQLRRKQQAVDTRRRVHEEDTGGLDAMVSVDEVEVTPMEDVEEDNAVHSPPSAFRGRNAKLSIPGHLRVRSPFSVLSKYPEGLRKRKSVHVDTAEDGEEDRVSLKKTSSQINMLAASSSGKLSRSSSASGDLFQTFAARQRLGQDQEMEDACASQPQSPQNSLFGNKHGRLSACS